MMKIKIIILVISFFTLITLNSTELVNEETNSIIIYPFYTIQNNFPDKFKYLSNTIQDIIKQEIIDKALFYLIENNEILEKTKKLNLVDDFYKNELLRTKISRLMHADYFCYGYIVFENEKLKVYFHLIDVKINRTKKIDNEEYNIDIDMFKKIEQKAYSFAEWINTSLPNKKIINKAQNEYSEYDLETQKRLFYFDYYKKRYFEIGASFSYYFFLQPFSLYVKNNFGAEISLKYFIPKATFLYTGLSAIFYLLDGKSSLSLAANDILVFNIPVIFKFGVNLNLVKYLEIDCAIGHPISIFAGYLIDQTANYIRPGLFFDLNLFFTPNKYFKLGAGMIFFCSFAVYNNWILTSFAPRISIGASF